MCAKWVPKLWMLSEKSKNFWQNKVSEIRVSEIRVSKIRASEIRVSEIRVSKIRVSEIRISSNHHELHGAIFVQETQVVPHVEWQEPRNWPSMVRHFHLSHQTVINWFNDWLGSGASLLKWSTMWLITQGLSQAHCNWLASHIKWHVMLCLNAENTTINSVSIVTEREIPVTWPVCGLPWGKGNSQSQQK